MSRWLERQNSRTSKDVGSSTVPRALMVVTSKGGKASSPASIVGKIARRMRLPVASTSASSVTYR